MSKEIEISIVENSQGGLCISLNDYRIAGRKLWGGGNVIKQWHISLEDIEKAVGKKFEKEIRG